MRLLGWMICLLLTAIKGYAQPGNAINECAAYRQQAPKQYARITTASPLEEGYDINYLKFDLILDTTSAYIQGSVTTFATVTGATLAAYVFELSDTLSVDSVKIDGVVMPCDTAAGIGTVLFTQPHSKAAAFSVQVYYHGYARNPKDIIGPGFRNIDGLTYSSVEPYFASTWWPCKQSLSDKIDSVDIWVTVPANIKVGSNGLLQHITQLGANAYRYEWKERYPIDYYLISVAVSDYAEYSWYMHFTGSTDSMLIMNYVPPALLPQLQPMLDTTALLVDYFSTLFGRYPFWKEKYGHSYIPSFVHMEHQTMTSSRLNHLTVIAHELAHQWFGDNVTCGSWKDIWLNEGFATYGQYLCYYHFNGPDTARSFMNSTHANVVSLDWGATYSYDTTIWQNIFDQRLSYDKGASVVHMLRYIVNDDARFYGMLQAYQQKYAGKTATTEDFRQLAETVLDIKLDTFLRQWIYGEGFPYYDARWNEVNKEIYLQIDQSPSKPAATKLFAMPVEVKLYSAQGDTIVKVYVNEATQTFRFSTAKTIDSIAIDPEQWLLYKSKRPPVKDAGLNKLPTSAILYPNPAHSSINVAYKYLNNAALILYDAAGRKMLNYSLAGASGTSQVDIHGLAAGVYVYRVLSGGSVVAEGKVVKK